MLTFVSAVGASLTLSPTLSSTSFALVVIAETMQDSTGHVQVKRSWMRARER